MAPVKFVIKCGNFAVLVDLHVLPLGGQEDASWFTASHIEEVTAAVRDSVDQRVQQYMDSLHNRRHRKQKKELAPASAFTMKGRNFSLNASFLKRHFTLRCIAKQVYGDLRVFPERYVVCVSCPEDATVLHGNLSLAATELREQSRSEYFSRVGETQELLNSPTKTKRTVLQKIVGSEKARVRRELPGSSLGEQHIEQRAGGQKGRHGAAQSEATHKSVQNSEGKAIPEAEPCSSGLNEAVAPIGTAQNFTHQQRTEKSPIEGINLNGASVQFCPHDISLETMRSKRCKPSDAEDPHPQRAKRTCLERPPATTHSTDCATQTSEHDPLPLLPFPPGEAKAESKAFPVLDCKKTTLEVELLTPGKRAQRLPLTSNNTAQTNQNRPATSLRGLSVKLASSGSSISSRSTLGEKASENVPRTSRLGRLKRS